MLRPWKFDIQLKPDTGKAVYLQIADVITDAIQSGRLKAGDPLPGSRNISEVLNVNRNTVMEAFDVLIAEGWLITKERRGTFVANVPPLSLKDGIRDILAGLPENDSLKKPLIIFDDGFPDSRIAPIDELARAYRQIFGRKGRWQMMGYSDAGDKNSFREAVSLMLNHQRGMNLSDNMVYITRGSQMAMYLISQSLFTSGDCVLVENPGYKPAWQAFESGGATIIPVPVDSEGLVTDEAEKILKSGVQVKAVYITPHHQYPTTVTLSLQRRMHLLELSGKYGFTIIEDDYDNEFHFGSSPVMPVCSHTLIKNYIYIGTFSKVVAPALRIGYFATNNAGLIEKVNKLRKIIDVQGDAIMEQAVLELINDGTIKRHINKATKHYKSKRDYVAGLLNTHLQNKAGYTIPEGGLAIWIVPFMQTDWNYIFKLLSEQGIIIVRPDQFSFDTPVNGLRLGYGHLTSEQLEQSIKALSALL